MGEAEAAAPVAKVGRDHEQVLGPEQVVGTVEGDNSYASRGRLRQTVTTRVRVTAKTNCDSCD